MASSKPTPIIAWWLIWANLLVGLAIIHVIIPDPEPTTGPDGIQQYLLIGPLIVSSLLRWFVLPRHTEQKQAFVTFIIGLALAEGTGILGKFLIPGMADTYIVLSLLGIAQFVPYYASKYKT